MQPAGETAQVLTPEMLNLARTIALLICGLWIGEQLGRSLLTNLLTNRVERRRPGRYSQGRGPRSDRWF